MGRGLTSIYSVSSVGMSATGLLTRVNVRLPELGRKAATRREPGVKRVRTNFTLEADTSSGVA